MAAITVHLDIVSIEGQIFSGLVEMLIVTGALGGMGILPGHAALLTMIKPGPMIVKKQGGNEEVFYLSGGILEVQPDIISVLADTIVRASELDEAKAIDEKERAERLFADKKSNIDLSLALMQLAQATAQLRSIKLWHRE